MSLTSLFVVNTATNCDNYIEEQINVTGCTEFTVRLNISSNAVGPFNIYETSIGSTPIHSGLTRGELISGVTVNLGCFTPTPTPTQTLTPYLTLTPTPSVTTTPTSTSTPALTQSATPTISVTPTQSSITYYAYLFVEPVSANTEFNQWMYSGGSTFRGFSNGIAPSINQNTFNAQMNRYISYSGWSVNAPQVRTSQISTTSGGVDSFGNSIQAYLFKTHEVPAGTVDGYAWFTWVIATGYTNGLKVGNIGVNDSGNPNSLNPVLMNNTYYDMVVGYSGNTIPPNFYRIYTTFGASNMRIDNSLYNLYFKGNALNP